MRKRKQSGPGVPAVSKRVRTTSDVVGMPPNEYIGEPINYVLSVERALVANLAAVRAAREQPERQGKPKGRERNDGCIRRH